jgi:hypothetical protein
MADILQKYYVFSSLQSVSINSFNGHLMLLDHRSKFEQHLLLMSILHELFFIIVSPTINRIYRTILM